MEIGSNNHINHQMNSNKSQLDKNNNSFKDIAYQLAKDSNNNNKAKTKMLML